MATGGITFSGLGSGIDTASMISQLVSLERIPINNMNTEKSNYSSKIKILQGINSSLQSLQTKSKEMDTAGEFLSYGVTSTNSDAIKGTATGSATPGTYDINITQLAKAERTYSDGFTDKDVAGVTGDGTLSITVGSADQVDITVEATDTLEDIVSKINSSDANVTAGLVYTGTEYKIQVNGNETGAENGITFAESGTLALNLDEAANQYQVAQDALLTIDDNPIKSSNNEVTDAVPGVTLNLKETTSSEFQLTVAPETASIEQNVKDFVTSYNSIMSKINSEFAFTGEAKGDNHLTGDSTLQSLQRQLGSIVSSSIGGLKGTYSLMSELGIKTSSDGTLTIDSTKLSAAVASDPTGVAELFSGTSDHSVDGLADKMDALVEQFINSSDGILTNKTASFNSTIDNLNDRIDRQEAYVTKFEENLRRKFTSMEVLMSSLTAQGNQLLSSLG
ncbi:MAG: flagellar filament capping protein FliD [Deltaproteobacteria bacterium]|nr:flagellar filament capping protein FliD [Deltaproteobacteria bacterium]